jgi:DNA mismatch endonuclease (patch repair protein)
MSLSMRKKVIRPTLKRSSRTGRRQKGPHDIVSKETRSRMMRAVKQRDTEPEIKIRAMLRSLGVFYRTRNRDLPGSPDIANRKRRWAVFVHGCFWHGHENCKKTKGGRTARIPVINRRYWTQKLLENCERDARKHKNLKELGFNIITVWECELADISALTRRLSRFFREIRKNQ